MVSDIKISGSGNKITTVREKKIQKIILQDEQFVHAGGPYVSLPSWQP